MHTLLADTVEMCGGSRKLITVFNQLGVTSSSDTHDRFVTGVASAQRDKTVWDNLPSNLFTAASVDNFDILQSHSAVYCDDQHRSYHGTTIQLVQPNPGRVCSTQINIPLSITPSGENISIGPCTDMIATSAVATKRPTTHSSASSPHNLGKFGPKRPRTLQARRLNERLASAPGGIIIEATRSHTPNLTMQGFSEGSGEKAVREIFESKMFTYLYTKHCLFDAESKDQLLCDFKDIFEHVECGSEPSNIHYMELVDEKPDSSETMRNVSELLLCTASSEHQNGYVVLTGDGKTYEHLMEIKRLYGSSLDKLQGIGTLLKIFSQY